MGKGETAEEGECIGLDMDGGMGKGETAEEGEGAWPRMSSARRETTLRREGIQGYFGYKNIVIGYRRNPNGTLTVASEVNIYIFLRG